MPHLQVSRSELDKVRTCKAGLNKMMARVLELKQVSLPCTGIEAQIISQLQCMQQSEADHP